MVYCIQITKIFVLIGNEIEFSTQVRNQKKGEEVIMRKRKENIPIGEKRLLDKAEVCAYLNLGYDKAIAFSKEIHAEVKIGRRCLYDRMVIDRYLDNESQKNES